MYFFAFHIASASFLCSTRAKKTTKKLLLLASSGHEKSFEQAKVKKIFRFTILPEKMTGKKERGKAEIALRSFSKSSTPPQGLSLSPERKRMSSACYLPVNSSRQGTGTPKGKKKDSVKPAKTPRGLQRSALMKQGSP